MEFSFEVREAGDSVRTRGEIKSWVLETERRPVLAR